MIRNPARDRQFSARALDRYSGGPTTEGVRVRAAKDGAPAEILVYDMIGSDFFGEGVTTRGVMAALADAEGGPVTVRVNSPGGDAFEGIAIYNTLKAYPGQVNVVIDGLAASAASIIAMAGDTVTVQDSAFMMIHNVSTLEIGDRHAMTAQAETLGKMDGQVAEIYARFTGKDAAGFAAQMDVETWFTGDEALAAGLATAVAAPAAKPKNEIPPVIAGDNRARRLRLAAAVI